VLMRKGFYNREKCIIITTKEIPFLCVYAQKKLPESTEALRQSYMNRVN
jgi:hypothetical protein